MNDYHKLMADLRLRTESHRITVVLEPMDREQPGKFNGPTITLNPDYDLEKRCFYLVHSVGSIVLWSIDRKGTQKVFDDLRAAKKTKDREPERFAAALERFCDFEEASSEHAVWLLAELGHAWAIPSYTEFFRADIESMIIFHREGVAPVWRDFFSEWKERVARGEKKVPPFTPRPIPSFTPVRIPPQEVVHEIDGQAEE